MVFGPGFGVQAFKLRVQPASVRATYSFPQPLPIRDHTHKGVQGLGFMGH